MAKTKTRKADEPQPAPTPKTAKEKASKASATKVESATSRGPYTLAIDIGGTGIKGLVLDAKGRPQNERVRIDTPRPATPTAMLVVIQEVAKAQPKFDRVSVGFPGVVRDGIVQTAPNLDPSWHGTDLAKAIGAFAKKPTRVLNDAAIQGYGAIEGKGVELVLTLGTGLGSSLFVDGHVIPLEFGHHPFKKGSTYEEYLDDATLKRIGKKKWSKRLLEAVEQLLPIFNPRVLYLGGGNARRITVELPQNVRIVDNDAGMLGGIALWR